MSSIIRRISLVVISWGIDPRKFFFSIISTPRYFIDIVKYALSDGKNFKFKFAPILSDRLMPSGVAKGHYFHQDLWAARKIYNSRLAKHLDVGSRVDGFVAHLLVFMEIDVFDIRYIDSKVRGLHFKQVDIMDHKLSLTELYDSISCLHALEHFGLGRYGDPINKNGWLIAIEKLVKLLKKGGRLYISVPVGEDVVEFNAHRIFNPQTILLIAESLSLRLVEFSYINDDGDFVENVTLSNFNKCDYGCGCFEFELT